LGAPVKWNDHKPTLSRLSMLQFLFVFVLQFYIERAAEAEILRAIIAPVVD
jgi:hypothetical protein